MTTTCQHRWSKDWVENKWVCIDCGIDDPTPPPVARASDPETSWDAARSTNRVKMTKVRQAILDLLKEFGPMTDEEIWRGLMYRSLDIETSPSGARTRRSELVAAERVRDTGLTKKGKTNRKMILWGVA